VAPGAAAGILRTLEQFGFEWDGEIVHQSGRTALYETALEVLRSRGLTFECSCSRSVLADEDRYPGHCREHPLRAGPTATRLRIDRGSIQFTDRIQGTFRQDVAAAVGDIVLCRRDRLFAYVLAVVLDDASQKISDVVRGADLLDNTPRQIYLQQLLGLPSPRYAHVPVLTEPDGRKLAKSRRSVAITPSAVPDLLHRVFGWLGLPPPPQLDPGPRAAWEWAISQWRVDRVPRRLTLPV
jgi:glutamyl-Q tRNA(Asp) synthetase